MPDYVWQWPAIGQEKVIEFLERARANNKIAQAYIFSGFADLGKMTLALALARNLQSGRDGFDSDLQILQREPGKKNISISQTREFIKNLNLSSFLNSYKIGIIDEADLLSEEAKHALLKTLEEPKDKVVMILLVKDENGLPATIWSRAQVLRFQAVSAAVIYDYLLEQHGAGRALAKDLANLALGRPLVALAWLQKPEEYQQYLAKAEKFLSIFGAHINDRLKVLDELFSDKTWSDQAVQLAGNFLDLAESLGRDLFLLSLGQTDRIQHSALLPKLQANVSLVESRSQPDASLYYLNNLKMIAQAREYLQANVNPRLVIEQLAMNL